MSVIKDVNIAGDCLEYKNNRGLCDEEVPQIAPKRNLPGREEQH